MYPFAYLICVIEWLIWTETQLSRTKLLAPPGHTPSLPYQQTSPPSVFCLPPLPAAGFSNRLLTGISASTIASSPRKQSDSHKTEIRLYYYSVQNLYDRTWHLFCGLPGPVRPLFLVPACFAYLLLLPFQLTSLFLFIKQAKDVWIWWSWPYLPPDIWVTHSLAFFFRSVLKYHLQEKPCMTVLSKMTTPYVFSNSFTLFYFSW